ncbi:MAG: DUF502 domain-containing protein [Candidatus Omnitrophota bacterium]
MDKLRRVFLTGLLALVPISVSVWIIFSLTRWLESILGPIFKNFLKESYVPGIGIISLLLIILLIGYLTGNFVGNRFMKYLSGLLEKLPLFNKIYLTIKGISDSVFSAHHQKFFEAVVMVPFPHPGCQSIAFITAAPKELGPDQVGVFVPTVPNISTGFYLIYPKKDVKFLDMPVQEGIKLVLSIGISSRGKKNDETCERE